VEPAQEGIRERLRSHKLGLVLVCVFLVAGLAVAVHRLQGDHCFSLVELSAAVPLGTAAAMTATRTKKASRNRRLPHHPRGEPRKFVLGIFQQAAPDRRDGPCASCPPATRTVVGGRRLAEVEKTSAFERPMSDV
jgi:hypothetical protein